MVDDVYNGPKFKQVFRHTQVNIQIQKEMIFLSKLLKKGYVCYKIMLLKEIKNAYDVLLP